MSSTFWKRSDVLLEDIAKEEKWFKVNSAINSYQNDWGFRCSGELMFFSSNYIEKPKKLVILIQSYLKTKAKDPSSVIEENMEASKKTLRTFRAKVIKRTCFSRHLQRLKLENFI